MDIIFTILSVVVIVFLLMLSLTLLRIEKGISIALILVEKMIVKTYGKK